MSAEGEQEEQQSQPCRRREKNKQPRTRQQTKRGAGPLPRGGRAGSRQMPEPRDMAPAGLGAGHQGRGCRWGCGCHQGRGSRLQGPVCSSPLRISLSRSAKERESKHQPHILPEDWVPILRTSSLKGKTDSNPAVSVFQIPSPGNQPSIPPMSCRLLAGTHSPTPSPSTRRSQGQDYHLFYILGFGILPEESQWDMGIRIPKKLGIVKQLGDRMGVFKA